MATTIAAPAVRTPSRQDLLAAGGGSLSAGVAHALFAAVGLLVAPLMTLDYTSGADEVGAFRWYGLLGFLLVLAWGVSWIAATHGLARLAWPGGSYSRSLADALGTASGTLVLVSGGVQLASFSGAATDLLETGADSAAQAGILQGAWIVIHGGWYAAFGALAVWLVAFAVAARRARALGTAGMIVALLVAASGIALTLVLPYPTVGPFVSAYLLVLGIVLLVRARRTRGA